MTEHDRTAAADGPALPLAWGHEISEISAGGLEMTKTASEAERQAFADALGILECPSLVARYRIRRGAGETYRVKGQVTAEVVQACVVTLKPVFETLQVPVDVEFVPEDEARSAGGGAVDLDDTVEIEALDGSRIDVGRVVFEEVAAALNPYPRRPGAEFAPSVKEDGKGEGRADNPFAVLKKLQPKD